MVAGYYKNLDIAFDFPGI